MDSAGVVRLSTNGISVIKQGRHKLKTYTVGQVIKHTKNLLENDIFLGSMYVTGEISNCKYHSMGHIYFSLKDETGSMPAVMFKGNRPRGLKFQLQDGQAVVMKCSIGMYEKTSSVQLYATEIILAEDKEGKLNAEFLKLKEKLYNEGLFDFEVKKKIPQYAKNIGIVTAPTGAAIQDIINVAKRRNPYVQLILYPAKVQGEGAAETIVKGIKALDKMGLDIIIVGRGGGSIEDLWAFNEEIVARAIYEASTPIISGTGHEIDNTIADYVADLRAPTPSAAAEIAVTDVMTSIRQLHNYRARMDSDISNRINIAETRLQVLRAKLDRKNPERTLLEKQQRLADYRDSMDALISRKLETAVQKNSLLQDRLRTTGNNKYRDTVHRFEIDVARLHALSPTAKLINGFGYITTDAGPLRSAGEVTAGDRLSVTLSDGTLQAEVVETNVNDI